MEHELVYGSNAPFNWPDQRRRADLSWGDRMAVLTVSRLLRRLAVGRLEVRWPDGSESVFSGADDDGPSGCLTIRDVRALRRLIRGGDLGFAEAFLDGQWDTPDLVALLELGSRNQHCWQAALRGSWPARFANRLYHRLRRNTRLGSRRNIAAHYDLGNEFYARWLDSGMSYSSALYGTPDEAMAQAQTNKYQRIAELAGLSPEHRVLEIGCGWGGFMEHAAARVGCRVEGITLSREQLEYANRRMVEAGLNERAAASLTDYRDTAGSYDAIVSIEMLEAVGESHWPTYFRTLRDRLKPGGNAVLQVITLAPERFENYRNEVDFIQRHVFPGGMLPTPEALRREARRAGLVPDHEQTFADSYARTLAQWRASFNAAWPEISRQGFDERFRRLWNYYLCYCEAGFKSGAIDVGIYRLHRPA